MFLYTSPVSTPIFAGLNRDVFDSHNPSPYTAGVKKGVDEAIIRRISDEKNEPAWMREHRLKCFAHFQKMPMPMWGADLSTLDLQNIIYYASEIGRASCRERV